MTSAKKEWVRGDGDQWDIVTSVGYTALAVAAMRAVASSRPQPLARDDYAQHFVRAAGEPYLVELMADSGGELNGPTAGRPTMFGIQMRFFDTFFADACASGVQQAVVMAAGLDARAYRLQWPAGTHIFEVDQPEVLAFKSRVLAEQGALPRAERHEVAVDLRDDWIGALKSAGFDPSAPTAWLLEGLLMYLPGTAHDALFERIDEHSAPGSRLATHVFARIDGRTPGILPMGQPLDPFAEINLDGLVYDDDRLDPPEWLTTRGWRVEAATASELGERYGKPLSDISEEFVRIGSAALFMSAAH
jgi:methyltransferase (TIGR00027 family)